MAIIEQIKKIFAFILGNRYLERYFVYLHILEIFNTKPSKDEISHNYKTQLIKTAFMETPQLLEQLNSNLDGLTEDEADELRDIIGLNKLDSNLSPTWWRQLWECYRTPFNILLSFMVVISYWTDDTAGMTVIVMMICLSTLIRFVQERRSSSAAEQLKAMVKTTATVIRRLIHREAGTLNISQHKHEVNVDHLVPGDIIHLSSGDMIPADTRILFCKDLFINQASMTGEAMPVEKYVTSKATDNIFDLENICYMGTNVISGTALGIVIATGRSTFLGELTQHMTDSSRAPTNFQTGVNKISWTLIQFTLVMMPIILLINGFTKHDWFEAFLFAVSVAVGLTPEMLPMIVTTTLAKGATIMSKQKVIVKHLDAIQSFGAMTVLCTDKTGTLTQNKIFLERHTDAWGENSDLVLEYAYLNSFHQTGLKNLLDVAVLEHVEVNQKLDPSLNYEKIDEIPFDFMRRRMSVIVADQQQNHILICKGALEEMLTVCSHVYEDGQSQKLTPPIKTQIMEVTAKLNQEGLRIVAVARKIIEGSTTLHAEIDLELLGYIAFLDPPKESAAPAIQFLKKHGIEVKILTGDNELVTKKICKDVGLPLHGILLGHEVDSLSDRELAEKAKSLNVFAKLSPLHKERIVRLLKENGEVVGFMGDGINDANALEAADIGISVDSAVDIAKESADIIMLEKNLMILGTGVLEGRRTFANLLKYLKMAISSNFGNVFTILITSIFLPFLPLMPLQLLVQNLLYDTSQIAIPFDRVDAEALIKPLNWNSPELFRFMLIFGPLSSIFDILAILTLWFGFGANSLEHQNLFQSGFFIEGIVTQTLIVHLIRTRKIPFIESSAAPSLLLATFAIIAIGIYLPYSRFAATLDFIPVPLTFTIWLGFIVLGYAVTVQMVKSFYQKRFGWYH
ncbi:magnesium-translocating P-type ATPase [Candidatus Paracaedibacter symbiosus]|uniref:magnesium-translocating P-type ATPase n=1 Tax=Candidatus Paracaedibacter symbiosus TaxID=244582 RepID=UPI00050943F8|nr:magnesium-translocating P-type ATPase [Candidatus Paracaedibacter symbiosus]